MAKETLSTRITKLILNWKLEEANALLEANQSDLSVREIFELRGLNEQYQEYLESFREAAAILESDQAAALYELNQIPEDIRVTSPEYEKLIDRINTIRGETAQRQAEMKAQEAYDAIVIEFNSAKALDALDSARQICPNWDRVPELRDQILRISEIQEKLARGLFLQTEVSALREKGGLASYQKAMTLINEYSALGLEALGIVLFDADAERETLLKMMTRAEGESWSNRLAADGVPEERLKLEQSIRSLEDAESKNLRVLYNNNARLLILLSDETQGEDPTSERAIQANVRITELREKNSRLETEIHDEVAKRAASYCGIAEKALEAGELATAEINIRLAQETGKPAAEHDTGDYLGEVSLPTETLDRIRTLEERYAGALVLRNRISEQYRTIREEYNSDDNLTLNKLFSWVNQVDIYFNQDPHTPGLNQFRTELRTRYDAVRAYAFDKGISEIDRLLNKGDLAAAKEKLDQLNSFSLEDDDKRTLRSRQNSVNRLEDLINQADAALSEGEVIWQNAWDALKCNDESIQQLEKVYVQVSEIYRANGIAEPKTLTEHRSERVHQLQLLQSRQGEFATLRTAMSQSLLTIESVKIAEALESSEIAENDAVKRLLAEFWYFCAKADGNRDNSPRYLSKAEKLAEDAGAESLFEEISAFSVAFNNEHAEGQRVNFILDLLKQFLAEKSFTAGVDYINKNITDDDRAHPQIQQAVERLEQSYRIAQSEFFLTNAKDALADGSYQDAEDAVSKSLDFFYTLEAAQFQKMVVSRQQADAAAMEDVEAFLAQPIDERTVFSEEQADEIRYLSDKIDQLEKRPIRDRKSWTKVAAARTRIEKIKNQETVDFNNLRLQFENSLILGEQSFQQARELLAKMEARIWVENRSQLILSEKLKLDELENGYHALTGMIQQANSFVRQGDFRSATRILNSFQKDSEQNWPDWLLILKENAVNEVDDLQKKYETIQQRFKDDDAIPAETSQVLNPKNTDGARIFELSNELSQYKTILERDIKVDPEKNVYVNQINYLLGLLSWVETSNEVVQGTGIRGMEPSMDAIYATRKIGRDFFDKIPAGLVGIQPAFAARNKWLEQRTQVQQLLTQLDDALKKRSKQKKSERNQTITAAVHELDRIDLLPREADALNQSKRILKSRAARRSWLTGIAAGILLLAAALYLASPRLIPLLTPVPTLSLTPTITQTPTQTLTASLTPSPTLTTTPTQTLTPTATFTLTPTPMGLTGRIGRYNVGVYELPSGISVMLSDGYLPQGSEVNILRYCEPAYNKGEIWALIYYPGPTRNTGWIRVKLPDSPDYVSLSEISMPASEVVREHAGLKIECPVVSYQRMPGDDITATPSLTPLVTETDRPE